MKLALKTLALALLVSSCMMLSASTVTVGNYDSGNCYPLMCNDSGTSVGVSIDYQQAFDSAAFGGASPSTLSPGTSRQLSGATSQSWEVITASGGATLLLVWGSRPISPATTTARRISSGTASVPAGGIIYGSVLTLSGFTPFTYNPGQGDLLLEIVVDTQDNVPNDSATAITKLTTPAQPRPAHTA